MIGSEPKKANFSHKLLIFSGDDELDALIADSGVGGGGGHDSLLADLRISDFMDGEGVGGARFLRYLTNCTVMFPKEDHLVMINLISFATCKITLHLVYRNDPK